MVEKFCLESANYNVMHVFIKENTEWDKLKSTQELMSGKASLAISFFSHVDLIIEFKVKVHYTTFC